MALAQELKKMAQEQDTSRQAGFSARMSMLEVERRIREELPTFIKRLVDEAIEGLHVRDGSNGKNGIDGADGKDGSPDEPKDIKEKLESLTGEERLDASAVKNLPRLVETISKGKGGGGGSTLRVDNFSASANGSTRAFTATYRIGAAHALFYSGFPSVILPTTDYTVANRTVTLVTGVPTPQSGQSLLFIYEDGS